MRRVINAQVRKDFVNDRRFANVAGIRAQQSRDLLPSTHHIPAALGICTCRGERASAGGFPSASPVTATARTATSPYWYAHPRMPAAFARIT